MAAPQLKEKYLLRPVTPADASAVTELVNSFSQATSGINEMTPGEVASFWQTPGVDRQHDLRVVAAADGKLLGYAEALAWQDPPVHPHIWMRVHPHAAETEAPALLFDWALGRCSQALERVPPGLRVSISTFTVSGFEPLHRLFTQRGFGIVRHSFDMQIEMDSPPPAPVWPAGIEVKALDVEKDFARIYRAHNEAFADHFGHQEEDFETGMTRLRHLLIEDADSFDPSLWFVAMDGDEIAGYSVCRVSHELAEPSGWVNILGVRRAWRKRGLGLALLHYTFGEFYRRGWRRAGLSVDASSLTGAVQLYERAGMSVARRYDRYEKELRAGKELMTTELTD
jgi:GNAT superfamily N-acetyltransferase